MSLVALSLAQQWTSCIVCCLVLWQSKWIHFVYLAIDNFVFCRSSPAPVDQVIFPAEAEAFVQELKPTSVKDVGSER